MSNPAGGPRNAVTPGSVKILMIAEAVVIAFLSYWVLTEYTYDAYFHSYVDQVLLGQVATYTAVLGLGIGAAGGTVAVTLYKRVRKAKYRLGTTGVPRIRGAVEMMIPSLPGGSAGSSSSVVVEPRVSEAPARAVSSQVTAIVPFLGKSEPKKDAG